jgi:hypothetical protein
LAFGLSASLSPGTYELRLFLNAGQTHVAISNPITVQAASVSGSPSTVNPGGTLTASWSGIPNPTGQDWIGFYSAGAQDGAPVSWRYTTGNASGSLAFGLSASLSPGTYELRLFLNAGQTHVAISNPITVT